MQIENTKDPSFHRAKYKQIELDDEKKEKYEQENPTDWDTDLCCLCKFPLQKTNADTENAGTRC